MPGEVKRFGSKKGRLYGFHHYNFYFCFFPDCLYLVAGGALIDRKTSKTRVADIVIVGASLVFFGWSNFRTVAWLLVYIAAVYVCGRIISKTFRARSDRTRKLFFVLGILALIFLLGYYKYSDFSIAIFNEIFSSDIVAKSVATPLGISFITFTAISYLADIFKGKATTGSLLDCFLYISFFPKVISGPIVLWRDFSTQINERHVDSVQLSEGINRICWGFAKKVILADTFGSVIAQIDSGYAASGIDAPTAWLAVILYWLQIYYDFSGYSDIAIGVSKLFGFNFDKNFNFPYVSTSIAEFWRRWHISLGAWFREYVYFPLGGSRCSKGRTILNLAIVFALTGIWHGAGYNYILWGAINGFFVIIDHLLKNCEGWKKFPSIIKWAGTTIITVAFWELFRFSSIGAAYDWLCVMVGKVTYTDFTFSYQYFLNVSTLCFMIIGVAGATLFGVKPLQDAIERLQGKNSIWFESVKNIACLLLFVLSVIYMVNATYSPFIYFQY